MVKKILFDTDVMIEKIIRWILVFPGAFAAYTVASYICPIGANIVSRGDVGLIGYYTSLFFANIFGCAMCGAVFTVTGLWISPKKSFFVSNVLITLALIIFAFNAYAICVGSENLFIKICTIIWSCFGVVGAMYGADCYIKEYKDALYEEELYKKAKENNKTSKEEHDKFIQKHKKEWRDLIEQKEKWADKHKSK